MLKLFKYDLNIQLRSGYWTVYGVIGLLYIVILVNLPIDIRDEVAVALIFMDTSVLGLIFVGALVLLEKQQGVLSSMSVTPLNPDKYLFSKALSLTLLSSVVSSLIWIIPLWSFKAYGLILPGVIFSSVCFTLFGLGFSAGAGSFNQFIARIMLGSLILTLPLLPMIFIPGTGWLVFLPTNAALDLFLKIISGSFSLFQILDLAILVIWIFIFRLFAQKQFKRNNLFL
jgi:fluoroquinolone transport system permease protein